MRQPKEQRFQLFLHEMHEPTARAASLSGRTLSSEVRHRVKASFVLDGLLAKIENVVGGPHSSATFTAEEVVELVRNAMNE